MLRPPHGTCGSSRSAAAWLAAAVLAVSAVAGTARAQPADAASYAKQAEKDARAGRFEAAVDGYRRALDLSGDPAYLFNLSVVYLEGLKEPVTAWELAVRYGETARTDEGRKEAAQLQADIEAVLARTRGKVTVDASPATAVLYLDRREPDRRLARRALWVEPGDHVVLGEAPGFEPGETNVAVRPGGRHEVALSLAAVQALLRVQSRTKDAKVSIDGEAPAAPPVERKLVPGEHLVRTEAPGTVPLEQKVTLGPGETLIVHADLEPARKPRPSAAATAAARTRRAWAWATIGTGAALAATGIALGATGAVEYRTARALDPWDFVDGDTYRRSFQKRVDRGRAEILSGYVLGAVGLATLGTGLYLYFTGPSPSALEWAPAGPGGPGVTATVRW